MMFYGWNRNDLKVGSGIKTKTKTYWMISPGVDN
jgi:hypothetical protein